MENNLIKMIMSKNNWFISLINIKPLKIRLYIFYYNKFKINIFFKKIYYYIYNGKLFKLHKITYPQISTKINQYIFTKKPFAKPLKKLKK